MASLFHEAGGKLDDVKGLARSRIADLEVLEDLVEHATYVKAFLTHVLDCTHARVDDCPEHQAQIRERAAKIAADDDRHHGHLRLSARHRTAG